MARDELPDAERPGKSGVAVLPFNGRKFAVGLRWHPLKSSVDYMSEARKFGRANGLDIVAIREGLVTQGGFVSKESGVTKEMYSAASVLTGVLGQSWLAVFQLDQDLFYLVAADKGAVIPDSDFIGDERTIRARMMELNSMFEWSDNQIIAPESWSFAGVERSLDSLLTAENAKKIHRLKQLTFGLSKREWFRYSAIALLLIGIGAGVWMYVDMQARNERERMRQEQEARRAELARLSEEQRRLIASSSLTRPWTLQPKASQMLELCEGAIYSLPLTIGGWAFTKAVCAPASLEATYTRTSGATNVGYLEEFADVFPDGGITTTINADNTASFVIAMSMPAGGDESNQFQKDVRNSFVSHFQRVERAVVANKVPSVVQKPDFLPDGTPWPENVPAPAADWETYSFNFSTADVPSNVLIGLPREGIRISRIEADFKGESTSFTWTTVGELYGLQ